MVSKKPWFGTQQVYELSSFLELIYIMLDMKKMNNDVTLRNIVENQISRVDRLGEVISMFQDMTKQLTESMEPFKDFVNIQTRMLENLTRHQMECTKACLEATMQQTKQLQQCKTPIDLMELQQSYAHALEKTLRAANEQNMKSINEARLAMESLAKGSLDKATGK